MKSNWLHGIRCLDKSLSANKQKNYLKFLGSVIDGVEPMFSEIPNLQLAIRKKDVKSLIELADSLSSQKHEDATHHFVANQIAYLIKKYPFPASLSPFDPEKTAKEKFWLSEQKCAEMNQRFSIGSDFGQWNDKINKMRSFMNYVLSSRPSLSNLSNLCDFTPGASIGVNGNASNLARKLASNWTVSPSAFVYGFSLAVRDWNIMDCINPVKRADSVSNYVCLDRDLLFQGYCDHTTVTDYNKIAFVPKTAKTHRAIAVEPLLNGFIQKGVDTYMRHRLKRVRLDLSDQSLNSSWARYGSENDTEDSFCTIDLSSASDSISIGLCRELLHPDWFSFLNDIRSKNFLLDGDLHRYEKFCSMGNGFCFPLETLIFAACCHACNAGHPGRDFRVYGDDIVLRKQHAAQVLELLEFLGFSANPDKTFLSGPFRESCGSDWFGGEDVRPFILDFAFDSVESIFKFLNLSRRNTRSTAFFYGPARDFIKNLLPVRLYQYFLRPQKGPANTGIDSELDEFMSSPYASLDRGLQGWKWHELLFKPVTDNVTGARDVASATMIAMLRGASFETRFTLRRKTRTAMTVVRHG